MISHNPDRIFDRPISVSHIFKVEVCPIVDMQPAITERGRVPVDGPGNIEILALVQRGSSHSSHDVGDSVRLAVLPVEGASSLIGMEVSGPKDIDLIVIKHVFQILL